MSKKEYYECHITMEGDREALKDIVLGNTNWKFSAIEGDIVLGGGVKCYATMHYSTNKTVDQVKEFLFRTANTITSAILKRVDEGESKCGEVVRTKVEHVIFDSRIKDVGKCSGGCFGCHLDDLVN